MIVTLNYLQRELFGALESALAPGGLLLYETLGRAHVDELAAASIPTTCSSPPSCWAPSRASRSSTTTRASWSARAAGAASPASSRAVRRMLAAMLARDARREPRQSGAVANRVWQHQRRMDASRILLRAGAALLTCFCAATATAAAETGAYTNCELAGDALVVAVSGASCDEARAVATALTATPSTDGATLLRNAGWAPLRAAATNSDPNIHDIVATRGRAALRIRRPGVAPDLDGWAAGRELLSRAERSSAARRPQAPSSARRHS